VLILDEAERLFPSREETANERILMQTARFFMVLRALAQESNSVSICAAAYRPNLNRWNRLGPRAGENALFAQFHEIFLPPLDRASTDDMLSTLGRVRGIDWTPGALAAAYDYTAGHPHLSRSFASDVTRLGTLKHIDAARVEETAEEFRRDFIQHRLTPLLREVMWTEFRSAERDALVAMTEGAELSRFDLEALDDLLVMGVVAKSGESYKIGSRLFWDWLKLYVC
jgi:hypothetical protein